MLGVVKLLLVVAFIALGIFISLATGGRWTALLIGAAVVVTLVALVPGLGWLVRPLAAYGAVWVIFNWLRAWADDTRWSEATLGWVPRLEEWLFGGRILTEPLQRHVYEPASADWLDYGLIAVYLSFFIVPHLVAIALLWLDRVLFWRLLVASAVLFSVAFLGFLAVPTAPPWLVAEIVPGAHFAAIRRITEEVLRNLNTPIEIFSNDQESSSRGGQVRIEPNRVAAMPSIHFAVTALLVFPARSAGRWLAGGGVVYAALMGIALVYLGEHYVLDILVGGVFAIIGWQVAQRYVLQKESQACTS